MRRAAAGAVLAVAGVAVALLGLRVPHEPPRALDDVDLHALLPPLDDAPRSIAELRQRIAVVLDREHVPGVGIALVGRDGPIWIGGVGLADVASKRPVDADTVFRVGSVTKGFVALGVMRLVDQGKLDLDRPLRDVLPDAGIANPWESVAPVTLAQALEHTAGLDDMHFNETFATDDAMSPLDALSINPRSRVVRWRPGTRMAYSNVGYTLAARAIEVVTREPFDEWLRREVLVPLGMQDADFRRTDALAARLATGYVLPGRVQPFWPIAHRAAGSLLASPTDLAKLVQFWLRRDGARIVSRAALDRIERTGSLPYPPLDTDYGLGNYGDVDHPVRSRGHDGGLPGFWSCVRYFPELGVGYVVLLNSTFSPRAFFDIRRLVFAYLARDRQLVAPVAAAQPPSADFFGYASPRHELLGFIDRAILGWHVIAIHDGLRLSPLIGEPIDLVGAPDGAYRAAGQSGSSIRFTYDGDVPIMIAMGTYAAAGSWWLARLRCTALEVALILIQLAPLYAIGATLIAAIRRRRVIAIGLLAWPALAGACLFALPWFLQGAALAGVLGVVHPYTIAICADTIVFAIAAVAALAAAIRWSWRSDRPLLLARLVPSLTALAAFGLAAWCGLHGWIGLRTWAW